MHQGIPYTCGLIAGMGSDFALGSAQRVVRERLKLGLSIDSACGVSSLLGGLCGFLGYFLEIFGFFEKSMEQIGWFEHLYRLDNQHR